MESAFKAATKTGAYMVSRVSQATKLRLIHQAKSNLPLTRNKLPPEELAKMQLSRIK